MAMVATISFTAEVRGQELLVRPGERFTSTHPVVRAHRKWFESELESPQKLRRQRKPEHELESYA
jgi:hypothetical protein